VSAAAGNYQEKDKVLRLVGSANKAIPARLQLHRIGAWWILGIHIAGDYEVPPELGFLNDHLASRSNIATYLHDTLSQHLVAMSLLLTLLQRDPALGSSPDLIRILALCKTCSRDLRVLSDVLTPALSSAEECNADEVISALQWYVEHLRDDTGLRVRFDADRGSGASFSVIPIRRTLLGAVLERWAEAAINHPLAGETRIRLTLAPHGPALQFLSSQSADPGIAAVLSSSILRESVRAAGGNLGPVASHNGASACLVFPGITETSFQ
jgi:hypothetical protein